MSEPEYPYPKRPGEPVNDKVVVPPPPEPPPGNPPSPPPLSDPTLIKFTCSICGKVFRTRGELTLHMETVHTSPKKKV